MTAFSDKRWTDGERDCVMNLWQTLVVPRGRKSLESSVAETWLSMYPRTVVLAAIRATGDYSNEFNDDKHARFYAAKSMANMAANCRMFSTAERDWQAFNQTLTTT